MRKEGTISLVVSLIVALLAVLNGCSTKDMPVSFVVREGGKTYIVDKTGYRWDVSQAQTIGFKPDKFQYGIGKDAIIPLNDSVLYANTKEVPDDLRVIGISEGENAHAYSVLKLRSHEVVNSTIGAKPIAVGY